MAIIRKTLANGRVIRKSIVTRSKVCCSGSQGALVSGLNEGVTTMGDFVFNLETQRMTRKAIRKARSERKREYLDNPADFQLYRGGIAFGKPKSMTGQEACDLNRRYEETFYRSKDPEARLWRWYPVGMLVIDKKVTLAEYRRLCFERSVGQQGK